MKISIIVPTYNSEKTIKDTLQSIQNQKYNNLEVIIIDGESTDSTLKIANNFSGQLDIKIISEKDEGIYDAMNKGVQMASGDIIHILNSDDYYFNKDILNQVSAAFEKDQIVDIVYGDIQYVDKDNIEKVTRVWRTGEYKEVKLRYGWIIPHPALFIRNRVYKKVGHVFDTQFKIAADYEFIVRLLKVYKANVFYIPSIFVTMRTGGASDGGFSSKIQGWRELRRSWKVNNLPVPSFLIIKRLLSKVIEFKI